MKSSFVTQEQIEYQVSKGTEILTSQTDGKRRCKGNKVPTHITTQEEIQKRKLLENEKKIKHKVVHPHPPVVIFTDGLGISVCKGCTKKKISHEEITYPHNMVFQGCGILGYYNKVLNKFINGEYNVHFHLKKSCL